MRPRRRRLVQRDPVRGKRIADFDADVGATYEMENGATITVIGFAGAKLKCIDGSGNTIAIPWAGLPLWRSNKGPNAYQESLLRKVGIDVTLRP